MRLATLQTDSGTRVVGVQIEQEETRFVDLRAADESLPVSLKALLSQSDGLARAAAAFASSVNTGTYVTGTLLAPIPSPGKVICIGLNYRDHAEESGMEIPTEPICFSKFSCSVVGPNVPVRLPAVAEKVDYEAELVAVIGRTAKKVSEADAYSYIAGYMNGNDVSARDWQIGRPGGQWLLGKTPDTFAPTGPYLVTSDEISDPHSLSIRLCLNGESMQDGNTREIIFRVDQLVAHLSALFTLEPGDLIFTGTPPGVGMARKPPVFLSAGDRVEVEIEGLGLLANPIEAD